MSSLFLIVGISVPGLIGLLCGYFTESGRLGAFLAAIPGLLVVLLGIGYGFFGDLSHDAQAAFGPVLIVFLGVVVCVISTVGWALGRLLR